MSCPDKQELKPQLDEGITDVIWADKNKHLKCMEDTFASIVELLRRENVKHYLGF